MMDFEAPGFQPPKKRRSFKKTLIYIVVIILIAAMAIGAWWFFTNRGTSPVPSNIRKSASFPVYYPDQKKLPAGYILNTSSFRSTKYGISYSVDYDQNKKLVFALQKKPSDNDIKAFYFQYLPLTNEEQTPYGKAQIGIYSYKDTKQTIASLPTSDNVWIIITGPPNTDQPKLSQVVTSLKK